MSLILILSDEFKALEKKLSHNLERDLDHFSKDIKEMIAVQTELMDADDVKYLIVTVPKYTAIVAASNGKVLRRRIKLDGEPENIPMYPYEMNTRLSSLRMLDYSAQPITVGSTVKIKGQSSVGEVLGINGKEQFVKRIKKCNPDAANVDEHHWVP